MSASTSAPMRLVLCPTVVMLCSSRLEFERNTVDAVAQMRRRRAIVEDVAEMTAAPAAVHLVAHHAVATVCVVFDRAGQRIVETGPAGPALKFHFGDEQRLITGRATECTGALFMQ